jgi:hypothetical protein
MAKKVSLTKEEETFMNDNLGTSINWMNNRAPDVVSQTFTLLSRALIYQGQLLSESIQNTKDFQELNKILNITTEAQEKTINSLLERITLNNKASVALLGFQDQLELIKDKFLKNEKDNENEKD